MADQTYGITEIVGTSPDSVHQAIRNGVARASQTLRNLDWFEVSGIRGQIVNGDIAHIQVQMKVGFRIETPD
ncbi:MAG TPA: dodecin [Mycobacteriales bacterium]|nr:dodecin [Mycobacteriales bacterium]